jgi:hypothetical protein
LTAPSGRCSICGARLVKQGADQERPAYIVPRCRRNDPASSCRNDPRLRILRPSCSVAPAIGRAAVIRGMNAAPKKAACAAFGGADIIGR